MYSFPEMMLGIRKFKQFGFFGRFLDVLPKSQIDLDKK